MSKEISKNRKTLYYVGNGITLIGIILFLSVFFIAFLNPFAMFNSVNPMANGFIGFILIIIGVVISNIGARGVAGSGWILDPKQAREDLKPYSSQVGGMINDALEEVELISDSKEVVKIRCQSCKTLNDEDAKYCKKCGAEL
ncbi:MAG: zinc ribbon domain-containing protein [Erysipelotrichaceae bacterium]|nr:zinc ribbon domain-containing protein [Erysipelotrichaceae bacterium]